jgi:hypothetical protein
MKAKAREMAEKGIDAHTVRYHLESVIGRRLDVKEAQVVALACAVGKRVRLRSRGASET